MRALSCLSCLFLLACGQPPPPGIRVGAELFARNRYYDDARRIGDIRSLTVLPSAPQQVGSVVVGGVSGAAFLLPGGVLRSFVPFDARVQNVAVLDLDGDGALEYMDRGGAWRPVGLLDARGKSLWRYSSSPDAMAAGDLDLDGDLEFVVGTNGSGGLLVFDERGIELWRRDATNVFSVAVLDTDQNGKPEIVHSHGGPTDSGIWIRDGRGEVIRRLRPGFESFSIVHWPASDSPPYLLGVGPRELLQIVDFSGHTVAEFKFPDSGHSDATGAPIRLGSDGDVYLAVARTLGAASRRSAFYVFDGHSNLIYHEILPSSAIGFAVLPADSSGKEDVLLGSGSSVWRYVKR